MNSMASIVKRSPIQQSRTSINISTAASQILKQSDIWKVRDWELPIEITILVLVALLGTIGNIFTLIATVRSKKLRTPLHLILAVVMVADLMICGIYVPFVIYGTAYGQWNLHKALCSAIGVMFFLAAGTSLTLNVVIALNRLLGCFPNSRVSKAFLKTKTTILCIFIAILYTFGLFSPTIVGYINVGYLLPYGACLITNDTPMHILYIYLTTMGALGAYSCITIIAFLYFIIFVRLRIQSVNFGVNKKKKTYLQATRNMALLYVFFVICWAPDVIHNNVDVMLEGPVWVTRICLYTIFLHSSGNPLIYVWRMPEYRKTILTMFGFRPNHVGTSAHPTVSSVQTGRGSAHEDRGSAHDAGPSNNQSSSVWCTTKETCLHPQTSNNE